MIYVGLMPKSNMVPP